MPAPPGSRAPGTPAAKNKPPKPGAFPTLTARVSTVYGESFTAGGGDPFTVLLCHFDGANGSTSFADSSNYGHVLTASSVTVTTTSPMFGTGSGDFSASSAAVISVGGRPADFSFGSGPFTVEAWVYYTSPLAFTQNIMGQQDGGHGNSGWSFGTVTGNYFALYYSLDGTNILNVGASFAPTLNTWYHLAADRDASGMLRVYVNGAVVNSSLTTGSFFSSTLPCLIGNDGSGFGDGVPGHIDEVRVTKGLARYGGAFTPPSAPFSVNTGGGTARVSTNYVETFTYYPPDPASLTSSWGRPTPSIFRPSDVVKVRGVKAFPPKFAETWPGSATFAGSGGLSAAASQYVAGQWLPSGVSGNYALPSQGWTELEFGLQVVSATNGDTFAFKVYFNGAALAAYNQTPSFTYTPAVGTVWQDSVAFAATGSLRAIPLGVGGSNDVSGPGGGVVGELEVSGGPLVVGVVPVGGVVWQDAAAFNAVGGFGAALSTPLQFASVLFAGSTLNAVFWNASDVTAGLTISNSGQTVTATNSSNNAVRGTDAIALGNCYIEFYPQAGAFGGPDDSVGYALTTIPLASISSGGSGQAGAAIIHGANGDIWVNGTKVATGAGAIDGHTVGVVVDYNYKMIWFRIDAGNWNYNSSADPATGAGGFDISAITLDPQPVAPVAVTSATGSSVTANFGQTAFQQPVPNGVAKGQGGGKGHGVVVAVGAASFAGSGSLSARASARFGVITQFAAAGVLSVNALPEWFDNANFVAVGTLGANASLIEAVSAGLVGTGALIGQATAQFGVLAQFSATGVLSANVQPVWFDNAALSATGALGATATLIGATFPSFAGSGVLGAGGSLNAQASASFAGVGVLSVNALPEWFDQAAFAASGNLTASAALIAASGASLIGVGGLQVLPSLTAQGTAFFAGVGTLGANISVPGSNVGLAGAGTLVAKASILASSGASLAGSGVLGASLSPLGAAGAALAGQGSLSAAAGVSSPIRASFAASGLLGASGTVLAAGQASLAGVGTLGVSFTAPGQAGVLLTAVGLMRADLFVAVFGNAAFASVGTLGAVASVGAQASAALAGSGSLAANATAVTTGAAAASLNGQGRLTAVGSVIGMARAALTGEGDVSSYGAMAAVAGASMAAQGVMIARGQAFKRGVTARQTTIFGRAQFIDTLRGGVSHPSMAAGRNAGPLSAGRDPFALMAGRNKPR